LLIFHLLFEEKEVSHKKALYLPRKSKKE